MDALIYMCKRHGFRWCYFEAADAASARGVRARLISLCTICAFGPQANTSPPAQQTAQ